ncbi:uncharacterized protein LOC108049797 [Drosophila rhopaloa]|uniref:Uncharacterized protein LOC108049797 n=1 Tax=Drosophila rhopaloa TaxID=1041015 RepID=A0A6P4FBV2_DRORH|nr:uncharacterized protein LOC108049797 [Drosophila rhopaloa]
MSPAEQLGRLVAGSDAYQLAASTGGGGGGAGGAGGGGGGVGGGGGGAGGDDAGGGGEKLKDMPDKYVMAIAHFLDWHVNETVDMERLSGPILKSSIKSVYWLFLIQYAALALLGVVLNVIIVVYLMYHRLYKDVTHAFIINLALCHFVQCALVLPVSLMVMLIQNWIFGQFLCFFLPMLQDIPLHVALISHILIAWDRMRWLNDPLKGRLPGFVCCCATWLTGMVIALPYPIYTMYVELGDYMPQLSGIGLCVVNLMDDMQEYTRGLFLLMYCGPAILLSYLYIRTSQELRPPDGPFAVMMYEHRADVRMRQRNSSTSSVEPRQLSGGGVAGLSNGGGSTARSYDLYSAELDVHREKRKQRNFGSMAATQVVCMCPLMILRFARLSLEETYENTKHFDFTYLMFVWMAFLPTVIFPCIYASQILPRDEQERLRGYFRLSSKRKPKTQRRSDAGGSREDSIEKEEASSQGIGVHHVGEPHKHASKLRHEREVRLPGHGGDRYTGAPHRQGKDRERQRDRDRERDRERDRDRDRERDRERGRDRDRDGDRERQRAGGRGAGDAGVVNNLGKDVRGKKHDVKINIISDGGGHSVHRKQPGGSSSSNNNNNNNSSSGQRSRPNPGQRHGKLPAECLSNVTASTFCNGSGSVTGTGNGTGNGLGSVLIPDDSSTSNYGDGEESSVVSSMMVPPQRWPGLGSAGGGGGGVLRHKDVSFSECSSSTFSSSTLERDLEIMDQLERERSMDIQEMLQRERERDKVRRQLPDIEKLYAQRSPKGKRVEGAGAVLALVMPGSDPLSSLSQSQSLSTEYSLCSTLETSGGGGGGVMPAGQEEGLQHLQAMEEEEVVPPDFYDSYTPGGAQNLPPVQLASGAVPAYQYQYSRNRLSRKSSGSGSGHHHHGGHHHGQHGGGGVGGVAGGRGSKRDSFNSLNGTDLIAGAFCELDPTQPLNKMALIEGRMRRSSPRNASFSSGSGVSGGRSSMKSSSRDYDYGHGSSSHSAHPELDFRENIFAEL